MPIVRTRINSTHRNPLSQLQNHGRIKHTNFILLFFLLAVFVAAIFPLFFANENKNAISGALTDEQEVSLRNPKEDQKILKLPERHDDHHQQQEERQQPADLITTVSTTKSWCDAVTKARSGLRPSLQINYPCEDLPPTAVSAVVCMITAGTSEKKKNRVVFSSRDYVNGVLALGASLRDNIDPKFTHQLLLLKQGFTLDEDDTKMIRKAGWTIGVAPKFYLLPKYVPKFPRYKTVYTKLTVVGLSEYKCVMLLDADTLVLGNLHAVLNSCQPFTQPYHRIAGTLDYYRGEWFHFNTGSILWKTSNNEMQRLYNLTRDDKFMEQFQSDQIFINEVYKERTNATKNEEIVSKKLDFDTAPEAQQQGGEVVSLGWAYNAQTHCEVQIPDFWFQNRPTVKILHFTEKKGWQCEERYDPPPPLPGIDTFSPYGKDANNNHGTPSAVALTKDYCKKEEPLCFCREGYLYWNALRKARSNGV